MLFIFLILKFVFHYNYRTVWWRFHGRLTCVFLRYWYGTSQTCCP